MIAGIGRNFDTEPQDLEVLCFMIAGIGRNFDTEPQDLEVLCFMIAGIRRNFDIEPEDLEVFSTETAIFQCSIKSISNASISWFKDNNEPISDRANKYRTYSEGVLEIYNVAFRDFGTYYCQAEGVDKTRKSRAARLSQKKKG